MIIYVAGPLGTKDPFSNAGLAIRYADRLRAEGHTPVIPHLNCFWAAICPGVPYEEWMRMDLEMVLRCNLLIRLPGESPGAEREYACAAEHNIPTILIDNLEGPLPTTLLRAAPEGEDRPRAAKGEE
jgi:hypothetical protein